MSHMQLTDVTGMAHTRCPLKNNIHVIYLSIRLTMKEILRDFLKEGDP
jgi:hypothetical protein